MDFQGRNSCLAFALVAGLAGCTPPALVGERPESFRPHAHRSAEGESIESYLLQRTAGLLRNVTEDPPELLVDAKDLKVFLLRTQAAQVGNATAIDRRGYFLTAAHCLSGPAHLLMRDRDGARIRPARVVWKGDPTRGEPDLALLSLDESLARFFSWTEAVAPQSPTLVVGLRLDAPGVVEPLCLAGTLRTVSEPGMAPIGAVQFEHDAPVRPGDSGGPLTDARGRLIGINVELYETRFLLTGETIRTGVAVRTDLRWLRELIADDVSGRRARRAPEGRRTGR